jgi:BBSome-interacting protein 1
MDQEFVPKAGFLFSEQNLVAGVMCKPKIMPLKSITLQKIEEMERKLKESVERQQAS